MKISIISFAILAAGILAGCQTSDFEESGNTYIAPGNALSLTISVADQQIVYDENNTRAFDENHDVKFEDGNRVGLIILDKENNFLANNVPYKYDKGVWDFDSINNEGKERVYYVNDMKTYIVYYPYSEDVDGCKSIEEIKAQNVFAHREVQTDIDSYRYSDLMAWSSSEGPQTHLDVSLQHLRNSLAINPMVRWKLSTGEDIEYQPLSSALIDFNIFDKNHQKLAVFHASDSTYRYILPDNYEGEFSWEYTYRSVPYVGKCTVDPEAKNARYVHNTIANRGKFSIDEWIITDLYCSKKINDVNTGYVLPWDASRLLKAHRCIGIVYYINRHSLDTANYKPKLAERLQGYVMSLTNATEQPHVWSPHKYFYGTTNNGTIDCLREFGGYSQTKKILNAIDTTGFNYGIGTAAEKAFKYGNNYLWQKGLEAPENTSGWYLPAGGTLSLLTVNYYSQKILPRFVDLYKFIDPQYEYREYITKDPPTGEALYWTVSERFYNPPPYTAYAFNLYTGTYRSIADTYSSLREIRPFLSF